MSTSQEHPTRASAASSPRWPSAGPTTCASATSPCSLCWTPPAARVSCSRCGPTSRCCGSPGAVCRPAPGSLSQAVLSSVTSETVSCPLGMVAGDHVLPGPSLHGNLGGCVGAVRAWEASVASAGGRPVVWREHALPAPRRAPGAGLNQVCLKALSSVHTLGRPPGQWAAVGWGGCSVRPERERRHWAGPFSLGHRSRAAGVM